MIEKLLGTSLPILQAPMAGSQGSALAAAVSNAGALGALPCAMLSPDAMRKELLALRAATDKPFNVNFFCHAEPPPSPEREAAFMASLAPYDRELGVDRAAAPPPPARRAFNRDALEMLGEFRPAVVSFHFGLPSPDLLDEVKRLGAVVLSSATTVEEARWLEDKGADAIIAQGIEAGGHRGHFLSNDIAVQVGTFALVPQLVNAVKVPVIAAGGIADANGVRAALSLGAAGVQVGTAYLLCPEATTSAVHRAAIAGDSAHVTAITNVFTGRPARGIVNRLMRDLGPMSSNVPPFPLAAKAVAPLRAKAEGKGSGDFSPLWAGQNVMGCKPVPAAEITRQLAAGLNPG